MTLAERLSEYVRAAFSGIYVHSFEHQDAIAEIAGLCRQEGWALATWDVDRGLSLAGPPSDAATGRGFTRRCSRSPTSSSFTGTACARRSSPTGRSSARAADRR